ncbi:hypothetical protein K7432_000448 [Basidiobolus ranarum]|uniref:Uncharacterized protein n=1 Tax=Basidiobolus ranarum TaxID=34480 RepID=A0ABR2X4J5_9FUNG
MFPGNSGRFKVYGRSFIQGIAELPSFFQQQTSLLSRLALRKSGNLLGFLAARPLLMDKPYWREDQLRNWHICEQTFRVKRDDALEPYFLIHQRFFEDITNNRTTVSIKHEDVKLPSPYTIYFLSMAASTESRYPSSIKPKITQKPHKASLFTLNSPRSSSTIASSFASAMVCSDSSMALRGFDNSRSLMLPDSDKSDEPVTAANLAYK